MRRYLTLALALTCLFALPVPAQFDSATVSGVIQDGTGGVLPGVDVTLTSAGTGLERRTVTNEAGLYTFPNVPVGEYRVKAALSGFNTVTKTGVTLSAGVNIKVDVQLAGGSLAETVQVTGQATHVDTSVIGRTVRVEQIEQTPLSGRRATQVAQLAPGVVGGAMSGSVPGGVSTFATGVTSVHVVRAPGC